MSDPEVSLTGGALAGAAVGTAVLPGVGTAIGARVGQQVEKLFGAEEPAKNKTSPQPQKSSGGSR
jgi:phage tail tape-measure protein